MTLITQKLLGWITNRENCAFLHEVDESEVVYRMGDR